MKQHSIQQKVFTEILFDSTLTSLEHLMVDLETTVSTRGWNKRFMIRINTSPGRCNTLNFFTHK